MQQYYRQMRHKADAELLVYDGLMHLTLRDK
jgi:hypothetical protein